MVGLVTVVMALWIARPLFTRGSAVDGRGAEAEGVTGELMEAKQSVYRSLIDLELDNKLGKLSPDDYTALHRQDKQEALSLIREIENQRDQATESEQTPEMTLEQEIRAARARLRQK